MPPTFPSAVPDLLQPGCRVIKTWNTPCTPDDDPEDEFTAEGVVLEQLESDAAGERWLCWFEDPRVGQDVGFPPLLLLTDRTSRAHLGWWIRDAPLPPCVDAERERYMASLPHPRYMDHAWCHEIGTRGQVIDAVVAACQGLPMDEDKINMLIKVGLHIAGLEPE